MQLLAYAYNILCGVFFIVCCGFEFETEVIDLNPSSFEVHINMRLNIHWLLNC